jgi:hypothetical protein
MLDMCLKMDVCCERGKDWLYDGSYEKIKRAHGIRNVMFFEGGDVFS